MLELRRILIVAFSLGLAALLLLTLSLAGAADIKSDEAPLNSAGRAYEVNPDPRGDLWISDSGANEIWQVRPLTGAYTRYLGMSSAADARMDAAGAVWWTDSTFDNRLGRISLAAGTVTTWTLPTGGSPWGIAFDAAGQVWTADNWAGAVNRFAPDTHRLCTYTLPDAGSSDYVLARGADIWLGDSLNARIVRLDPAANQFTSWQLPADAYPEGMALAENGDLWWADSSRAELSRLEPGSNRVTTYTLPAGTAPQMITLQGGLVRYTENASRTVGALDPDRATGKSGVVTVTTASVEPDCQDLGDGTTSPVITSTGTLAWSPATYTRIVDSGGWTVYQLPAFASPWGITTGDGQLYVVDQGRRQLLRLPLKVMYRVYLPYLSRP